MPVEVKQEKADLEEVASQIKSGALTAPDDAARALVAYTQKAGADKMNACDPKWAKKAGGGANCVIL